MCFVADFIREHNAEELKFWNEIRKEMEEMERVEDGIKRKIERGMSVSNLDSWSNRIKYYFLGYICTNGEGDDGGR